MVGVFYSFISYKIIFFRFQNRRMKHKKQARRQIQNTSDSPSSEDVDEQIDVDVDVVSSDDC